MDTWNLIIGLVLGAASSLGGIWLQSHLSSTSSKKQLMMEMRLSVYAKLLSATVSEEKYPKDHHAGMNSDEVEKYNMQMKEWRIEHRAIKAIASKALLIVKTSELRKKLSEFISSPNPEHKILNLEELMRNDIGI